MQKLFQCRGQFAFFAFFCISYLAIYEVFLHFFVCFLIIFFLIIFSFSLKIYLIWKNSIFCPNFFPETNFCQILPFLDFSWTTNCINLKLIVSPKPMQNPSKHSCLMKKFPERWKSKSSPLESVPSGCSWRNFQFVCQVMLHFLPLHNAFLGLVAWVLEASGRRGSH